MKRSMGIVLLVFLIFFVVSFLTNILGPLVPDIIKGFSLSLTLAGFLPFSFFVAYGVMSIPSGVLLDRFGQKPILISAFVLLWRFISLCIRPDIYGGPAVALHDRRRHDDAPGRHQPAASGGGR